MRNIKLLPIILSSFVLVVLTLFVGTNSTEAYFPDDDYQYLDIGSDLAELWMGDISAEEAQILEDHVVGFFDPNITGIGSNCTSTGTGAGVTCDAYYVPVDGGSRYWRLDHFFSTFQDLGVPHDGIVDIDASSSPATGRFSPANPGSEPSVELDISGSRSNPSVFSDDISYFVSLGSASPSQNSAANQEEGGPQCENEGGFTGFIFCDVFVRVLSWVEDVQTWIVTVLFEQDPLVVGETDDGLYIVWTNFRNLANGLLVVAFMFVIFSLAMSVNVDAYTIKRMVPRLLVAAVAIQASFFISALMVDLTNLLGAGLKGLTDMAMSGTELTPNVGEALGATVAVGGIVAGAIAAGAIFGFAALMPLFLLFLLVALGAFIIVALRELFIIMCIVLSPIAFLANLLPNTERWFKFWWSNFARLLFMYPFMILMIQLGNLGAYMMLATGRFSGATALGGVLTVVMALLMQLAATLSIYFAFKVGGSLLSLSTGGLSKLRRFGGGGGGGKGPGGRGRGPTGRLKEIGAQRKAELAAGVRGNKVTRAVSAPSSRMTTRSRAVATAQLEQQTAEAGKQLEAEGITDPNALAEFAQHGRSTSALRSRINELKRNGETDKANSLERLAPHAGKRTAQAAALKAAAGSGFVRGNMKEAFDSAADTFKDNPDFAQKLKLDAAVAANKAGRKDIWADQGPAGAAATVQSLGTKDFMEMNANSLDPNNSPSFTATLRDEVGKSDSQTRSALRSAMSPHNGMSADKHAKFKRALMNEQESAQYEQLQAQRDEAKRTGNQQLQQQAEQAMQSVDSSLYNQIFQEASQMPPPGDSSSGGQGWTPPPSSGPTPPPGPGPTPPSSPPQTPPVN